MRWHLFFHKSNHFEFEQNPLSYSSIFFIPTPLEWPDFNTIVHLNTNTNIWKTLSRMHSLRTPTHRIDHLNSDLIVFCHSFFSRAFCQDTVGVKSRLFCKSDTEFPNDIFSSKRVTFVAHVRRCKIAAFRSKSVSTVPVCEGQPNLLYIHHLVNLCFRWI